jgi:hypothetical protein
MILLAEESHTDIAKLQKHVVLLLVTSYYRIHDECTRLN